MKKITLIVALLGLGLLSGCGHSQHSHSSNDKSCTECKGHTAKSGCTDCGDKTASAGCPDCKTAAK